MFDLGIIGGGPGGYVAAERAAKEGLSVVLFEKNSLGGVCLNEGCIPTKTLLYSAKLYDHARLSEKYGVTTEGAAIDFAKLLKRKEKVIRKLVGGVKLAMKNGNVTVINAQAIINGKNPDGSFSIAARSGMDETSSGIKQSPEDPAAVQEYTVKNLLICTGSEAFVPPIKGLKEAGDIICTNREILNLQEPPKELIIIGGGVIGMEFASFFHSIGTAVTVIEMLPKILGPMDPETSAMLLRQYEKKGVTFKLGCKVTEIRGNTVCYEDSEGQPQTASAEKILVSVGRRAVLDGFGLETLNPEMLLNKAGKPMGIKVNSQMQTSVPHLYAAGDVTGFSMLAHTASREGEVAVNTILGGKDEMSYAAIPGVVYTNPEVAGVGLTEDEAAARGIDFTVARLPMAYSGRFVAENELGEGLCKLIIDRKDSTVIGAHLLGNPCSEIIQSLCIAIEHKLTVEQLKKVVFPHPTVGEIVKETLFSL